MIDFDDINTFPKEIEEFVLKNELYFRKLLPADAKELPGWKLAHLLDDRHLERNNSIQKIIREYETEEIAVWHAARILDEDSYWNSGICIMGNIRDAERRVRNLLESVRIDDKHIDSILKYVRYYWAAGEYNRLGCVHFFAPKRRLNEERILNYASNIGGEIVRWGIEAVDLDLYKKEPYKRLWILGKPSAIKFKCRLCDINEYEKEDAIIKIIEYFVITRLYNLLYDEIEFDGMKHDSVPPEDILKIEEIDNFIKMAEEYEEDDFYAELKACTN